MLNFKQKFAQSPASLIARRMARLITCSLPYIKSVEPFGIANKVPTTALLQVGGLKHGTDYVSFSRNVSCGQPGI